MATMMHYRTQRSALRAARESLLEQADSGSAELAPVDVLLRSGDTIRVCLAGRRITHERVAGHLTHGWCLDPWELPCICS